MLNLNARDGVPGVSGNLARKRPQSAGACVVLGEHGLVALVEAHNDIESSDKRNSSHCRRICCHSQDLKHLLLRLQHCSCGKNLYVRIHMRSGFWKLQKSAPLLSTSFIHTSHGDSGPRYRKMSKQKSDGKSRSVAADEKAHQTQPSSSSLDSSSPFSSTRVCHRCKAHMRSTSPYMLSCIIGNAVYVYKHASTQIW